MVKLRALEVATKTGGKLLLYALREPIEPDSAGEAKCVQGEQEGRDPKFPIF